MLHRYTDAALPYIDSALTMGSLLAQWMMTRKYVENWAVWVLLDVAYVVLFIERRIYPFAVLYAVFLVLAATGFMEWRRSWRENLVAAVDPAIRPA